MRWYLLPSLHARVLRRTELGRRVLVPGRRRVLPCAMHQGTVRPDPARNLLFISAADISGLCVAKMVAKMVDRAAVIGNRGLAAPERPCRSRSVS